MHLFLQSSFFSPCLPQGWQSPLKFMASYPLVHPVTRSMLLVFMTLPSFGLIQPLGIFSSFFQSLFWFSIPPA